MLKTQYYGGIKKYQWPVQPLALHGVVVLANGTVLICAWAKILGTRYLCERSAAHLAYEQMEKKAKNAVAGEALNIIVGNLPYPRRQGRERTSKARRS